MKYRTIPRRRPLDLLDTLRLGLLRMFTPEQIDFDSLLSEDAEAKRQMWRIGCFDSMECIPAISNKAPFPFMDKTAIHELFYLLKYPGDDDLSMLHLLSSVSKPPATPTSTQTQPQPYIPPLLRLPAELIHIILTHLSDTDAISLALSNTHVFNRASLRLHKLLEHRIPGGWAGKKIAVVGEKAYAPVSMRYKPRINALPTSLCVPLRGVPVDDILGEVFCQFTERKTATFYNSSSSSSSDRSEGFSTVSGQSGYGYPRVRRRLLNSEDRYPPAIKDIITFIDPHSKRTLTTIDPAKSYIIRNVSKYVYIVCDSFGRFREYLRQTRLSKPALKGTDVVSFTVEEAAVCAFAMKIMWGGEGKEGEWAGDGFDVVEGVGFKGRGGDKWVDVTEEVLGCAIEYIRRC
ncbi:hypothetical protein TWF694_005461 [Orbilia ellipsospora]|uniref:F-box domain-containing protein n=1 Tax=Orbilia ellipsospora TaxID=2528407 RepID=A0AAV9WTF6_9PEZI